MTWEDAQRQAAGLLFGVAVSVLVGVAAELARIETLRDVSLAGLAVTVVRSAATALLTLLGSRTPGLT
jgi:ABC-type uncharacterized transport system permease subunit